jgi:hypothetical protein
VLEVIARCPKHTRNGVDKYKPELHLTTTMSLIPSMSVVSWKEEKMSFETFYKILVILIKTYLNIKLLFIYNKQIKIKGKLI